MSSPVSVQQLVFCLSQDEDGAFDEVRAAFAVRSGQLAERVIGGDASPRRRSWAAEVRHDYRAALEELARARPACDVPPVAQARALATDPRMPAEDTDRRAAAAAAIALAVRAPAVRGLRGRRARRRRVRQLLELALPEAPGLQKAIRRLRMTTIAAQGGMGGG